MFQEQMMSVAMELAGFSGAEVDELRRALNYQRDSARLKRIQAKLRAALVRDGVSSDGVEEIVKMTQSFALYGFPESHAISFGLLAYASTYLKVHRPTEFLAALLNNQPMGFYGPATLLRDARQHGVRVHPACVHRSSWVCTVEADDSLRLGFNQVQGVRQRNVEELEKNRALKPFNSLADFRRRTSFSQAELRALARLGTLNDFCGHRRAALWQVEQAIPDDGDLFAWSNRAEGAASPLKPMNSLERMQADYRTQRVTTGPHPMKFMRDFLPDVWAARDVAHSTEGQQITIAGVVICRQRPGTAKGVVFISLEDETGISNAVIWPDLFERARLTITQEKFLRITGVVRMRDAVPMVQAERIERMSLPLIEGLVSHDFR